MENNTVQKMNEIQNNLHLKIIGKEDEVTHLQREIKQIQKRITQIEQSNTWKFAKPIRFLRKLSKKGSDLELVLKRLNETEQELSETKEQLQQLQLQDATLNTLHIQQLMREWKNEAQLIERLDTIIANKNKIQANYKDALSYIGRLYMNEDDDHKHAIYEKLMNGLYTEEIPEFMIRAGLSDQSIPLGRVASFRSSLHMRMRRKQLHDSLPEWILDDKEKAYHFVEQLHVRIPKIDKETYALKTIPQREGIVIKPVDGAGARGVYLVHRLNYIFDVKKAKVLTSYEDLFTSLQQDLNSGAVSDDAWMVEEIVYENQAILQPARDIKFYMFYGKVGLVLEIIREPEIRHCWWNRQGERVYTGKYEETLFKGDGVTEEEMLMIEKLSKEVPAPFLRIDFLRSDSGLVFGEFTPKPGDYDDFDSVTDQSLGDDYLAAQARLEEDLLQGKQFTAFQRLEQEDIVNV